MRAMVSNTMTPPGPQTRWWGLPLLRDMKADYIGFTAGLRRYGDMTLIRLGAERGYDLFTPELVRAAMVDHADDLVRWQRGIEVLEQLMGQSLLVTEGAAWQRQRRMLQPAFTPRRVAGYAEAMVEAAQGVLDRALPAGQGSGLVDMDQLFTPLAMDVILRVLFSSRAPEDSAQAAQAVQWLSENALREMFWPVTLPDWLPLPGKRSKRRALRLMRELVGGHIAARRAETGGDAPEDLLGMLLALRDEETGHPLSAAEIFDQCMVTFQAGHETSATALLWWSRLMAGHPEACARAQAELDQALAGRTPRAEDLHALPWLTATLKEALRLYPPIAAVLTRRTTRAIEIGGHVLPRGALLRITPWVLQRDPRSFDEPEQFRPERFLPDAPPPPRGAWMPFGTGPRVCLGQHFAMLEMTLVAALLLQRYRLALPPGGGTPMDAVLKVTLRPRYPVVLQLQRRAP